MRDEEKALGGKRPADCKELRNEPILAANDWQKAVYQSRKPKSKAGEDIQKAGQTQLTGIVTVFDTANPIRSVTGALDEGTTVDGTMTLIW